MNTDTCQHDYEYSEESEPSKGLEYWTCSKCETTVVVSEYGDEIQEFPK